MKVEFPIIVEHVENGANWFGFASVPDLPGCFATGNGLKQILRNAWLIKMFKNESFVKTPNIAFIFLNFHLQPPQQPYFILGINNI